MLSVIKETSIYYEQMVFLLKPLTTEIFKVPKILRTMSSAALKTPLLRQSFHDPTCRYDVDSVQIYR